jgi:hypothetical protein
MLDLFIKKKEREERGKDDYKGMKKKRMQIKKHVMLIMYIDYM